MRRRRRRRRRKRKRRTSHGWGKWQLELNIISDSCSFEGLAGATYMQPLMS